MGGKSKHGEMLTAIPCETRLVLTPEITSFLFLKIRGVPEISYAPYTYTPKVPFGLETEYRIMALLPPRRCLMPNFCLRRAKLIPLFVTLSARTHAPASRTAEWQREPPEARSTTGKADRR